jgi:hypothetical protein
VSGEPVRYVTLCINLPFGYLVLDLLPQSIYLSASPAIDHRPLDLPHSKTPCPSSSLTPREPTVEPLKPTVLVPKPTGLHKALAGLAPANKHGVRQV